MLNTCYVKDSVRITLFFIIITLSLYFLNFSQKTIISILTILVISERASFAPKHKNTKNAVLSTVVMLLSNVVGGVTGYYYPLLAKILTIIYATLAFYIPHTRSKLNIFILGTIIFIVSSASPFNLSHGIQILLLASLVSLLFQFYIMFSKRNYQDMSLQKEDTISNNLFMSITVFTSLVIALICGNYIQHIHTTFYTYWMMLTIVAVIQDSRYQTIIISLKRIITNILGALLVIVMFNYLPNVFWLNMAILYIILFCIFAFWLSYVARVFFLEMFVFGSIHIMGVFHTNVAIDRIIFTVVGGGIVVLLLTIISFYKRLLGKIIS
jgi:uncharacterized membrane protein YccC